MDQELAVVVGVQGMVGGERLGAFKGKRNVMEINRKSCSAHALVFL